MVGMRVRAGALAALLWLAMSVAFPALAQEGDHRAGLVVRYPDGKVETRCVAFPEASITGTQLLEQAGLQPVINVAGAFGGAVCSIRAQGCQYPAEDCFCKCMGAECEYWAYYRWTDGAWTYSQTGAGSVDVLDGDVQGWSWGPGDFSSGTEPPHVALADICRAGASAAATAADTPPNGGGGLLQYAAYGLIVALLAGAVVAMLLRRKG